VLAAPLAAGAHESEPTARSRHVPTRNPRRSPASDGGEVPYRPKAAQLAGKARPSAFAIGPAGGWRGLTMTPKALRLLQDLRRQLVHPPITPEVITKAVTAAA
jgi:hypothetical protein